MHGSRLSSAQWLPQLPLLEQRASVRLVDLPGHGTRVGEEFTLAGCVRVIDDAVDQARSEATERGRHGGPVVLVGHSLGGYVAMAYAAEHGARLDGLVLAGCSATPTGAGATVYRAVAALTARLGTARRARINDRVLRRLYPAELIEPVIAGGYFFDPTPAAWRAVMDECRPAALRDLGCPVLFLNGQWDQFRLGLRGVIRDLPRAQVRTIPRAGHLSNLDQPDAFAEAVLAFAGSLPDRSG